MLWCGVGNSCCLGCVVLLLMCIMLVLRWIFLFSILMGVWWMCYCWVGCIVFWCLVVRIYIVCILVWFRWFICCLGFMCICWRNWSVMFGRLGLVLGCICGLVIIGYIMWLCFLVWFIVRWYWLWCVLFLVSCWRCVILSLSRCCCWMSRWWFYWLWWLLCLGFYSL